MSKQSPRYNVTVSRTHKVLVWSIKYSRNYGDLNLDGFKLFGDICTTLCPRHFGMKPLFWGSEASHSERIYIAGVQRQCFSWIDQKLSKLRGSERFLDIWGCLNTLFNALWYEASVLEFSIFTQGKYINCRCATSRFQFHRSKIVEITGVWICQIWDISGYLYKTLLRHLDMKPLS